MEAIFGTYKLIGPINNPRPEDVPAAPVVNQGGAGVAGGGGGGDGGDAGVGGVALIQQPALVPGQQPVPPGPTPDVSPGRARPRLSF
jgi:hypothetical protein